MRLGLKAALVALVAIAIAGGSVLGNTTRRRRQIERDFASEVHAPHRYVDFGVVLPTVVADPVNGTELLRGKPKLRIIRSRRIGGMVDTMANPPRLCGPSQDPRVWPISEDQERVLFHNDPAVTKQLVFGSAGAGKTTVLVMWHFVQILSYLGQGREGGQTAPVDAKFDGFHAEVARLWDPAWYTLKVSKNLYCFVDGSRVRLLSTTTQNQQDGSRISTYTWSWAGMDEGQDQSEQSHFDVLERLRGHPLGAGKAPQLMTATNKDSYEWKEKRDRMRASGYWLEHTILGERSPFVHPSHWVDMAAQMTDRAKRLRVDAETDLPMERASYPQWDRKRNLIRIPASWEECTQHILRIAAQSGAPTYSLLVGHDPGSMFDVSECLKAFRVPDGRGGWKPKPAWVVVDEITTEETTSEEHVAEFLPRVREQFGVNLLTRSRDGIARLADGPRMLVHADPYGLANQRPDKEVYTILKNNLIDVRPAAYSQHIPKGQAPGPGQVPKKAGIEMVQTLLCNSQGERRLFVALKDDGTPVAPKLVKAFEQSQKNEKGEYETEKKNRYDLSHWPACIRYALWRFERPRTHQLDVLEGGLS